MPDPDWVFVPPDEPEYVLDERDFWPFWRKCVYRSAVAPPGGWESWLHGGIVHGSGTAPSEDAPCDLLLDEPETVLLNAECRPHHICDDTFRFSCDLWTHKIAPILTDGLWPLPIGLKSITRAISQQRGRLDRPIGSWELALGLTHRLEVAEGDDYAALIVTINLVGGKVEFFGTARNTGEEPLVGQIVERFTNYGPILVEVTREGVGRLAKSGSSAGPPFFVLGPLRLRYSAAFEGKPSPTSQIAKLEKGMLRIWNPLIGQPVPGLGRGSGHFKAQDEFLQAVGAALKVLTQSNRLNAITQESVAQYFEHHAGAAIPDAPGLTFPNLKEGGDPGRQMRKWQTQHGTGDWPTTRAAAWRLVTESSA